ncbi:MAG: hypothetical protein HQL29_06625, partial [Candidatus Omnitrophica bacterium]|nr:hypothetical protein [Candidatus Omnitrophota bacterium]
KGVRKIDSKDENKFIAWKEKEIFCIKGNEYKKISSGLYWENIDDIASYDKNIWVLENKKIIYSNDEGASWQVFRFDISNEEENYINDEIELDQDEPSLAGISGGSIDFVPEMGIIISQNNCIYILSKDLNVIRRVSTYGMSFNNIGKGFGDSGGLVVFSRKKVYFLQKEDIVWKNLFTSLNGEVIKKVFLNNRKLLIVCENSILINDLEMPDKFELNYNYGSMDFEVPNIKEVQKMAVEYAEVSNDKIKAWREGARWKALMPKLSLGCGKSDDDNVEIYKSATSSYVVEGPRQIDYNWDVDLSWDLSDLIWNESQTSIDVRSKLMVQLRQEILEEVTRLYYERERLVLDLKNKNNTDTIKLEEKSLRLREITSYIDALTGGEFSDKS